MTVDAQIDFEERFLTGLTIVVSQQGATTTIALVGEWDLAQREKARDAVRSVLARQPGRVVFDLRRLTFMDSTGIQSVLELANRAAGLKIDLVVIPGAPAVQRVFELCGLSERLTFVDAA
jgi:anti-sigma B factor antagonist